jgi:nucleoredoxin
MLVDFYNKYNKEKNFEIIFLSSDRDFESFNEYYKDMPWLTLDFKERKKKDELSKKYNIKGIPTFILLDGDYGNIICQDARNQIQQKDTKGEHFPWKSEE